MCVDVGCEFTQPQRFAIWKHQVTTVFQQPMPSSFIEEHVLGRARIDKPEAAQGKELHRIRLACPGRARANHNGATTNRYVLLVLHVSACCSDDCYVIEIDVEFMGALVEGAPGA